MRGLSLQLPIVSAKNSAAIVGQCWLPIAATWAGAAAALRGGIEVIGLRVPAVADWWSRCYSDPQVRRRRLSEVLLLAGFELLHAGLELLDLMPQGCEIACHRLKQLGRISRCGGRHDGFRCDLGVRLEVLRLAGPPQGRARPVAPVLPATAMKSARAASPIW